MFKDVTPALIQRAGYLSAIREALKRNPAVSVLGPGQSGKTDPRPGEEDPPLMTPTQLRPAPARPCRSPSGIIVYMYMREPDARMAPW